MERAEFGRRFTEHMAVARFGAARGWTDVSVVPFADLCLSPAAMVLHYGQAVFEGLKAFRTAGGEVHLFRPDAHAARFDRSARRLVMPELPPGAFTAACAALVGADADSVPCEPGRSLYLRPMLLAVEAGLGVRPAAEYLFAVFASAAGSYFSSDAAPLVLWATDEYARAAPGGTGSAKCAGNYAASLAAKQEASDHGCDEVLWLDAGERRWVEELSGMNVVFVARGPGSQGRELVTPPVGDTILDGVTRRSLLEIAGRLGYAVVERPVSLGEVCDGRTFVEAFACGTAVGVAPIGAVRSAAGDHRIGPGTAGPATARLRDELLAVQQGCADDPWGWRVRVRPPGP